MGRPSVTLDLRQCKFMERHLAIDAVVGLIGMGHNECFRIAATIEEVFHPTISLATELTAVGILWLPQGLIPIMGLSHPTAKSISYWIHSLYAAYIPDMMSTAWVGLI